MLAIMYCLPTKFKNNMQRILLFAVVFMFILGCEEKEQSSNSVDGEYIQFLNALEHLKVDQVLVIDDENSSIYNPHKLVVDNSGNVIVVDHSNWSLHLLNMFGEVQDVSGGLGEGPGEFGQINHLEVGSDGNLYVLDLRLQRVSIFSIDSTSLNYQYSRILQNYSSYRIHSIHLTDNEGLVGVFRERLSSDTQCQPFYVYTLQSDLTMDERLFEMPCNETFLVGGQVQNNELGYLTYWTFDNKNLYYSRSDEFSFQTVNLAEDREQIYKVNDVPVFKNEGIVQDAILERMELVAQVYPTFEEEVKAIEDLTLFVSFIVDQNFVYYSVFSPLPKPGKVLQIEKESGEIKAIDVPSDFVLNGVHEEILFGIDHDKDGSKIVFVNFER